MWTRINMFVAWVLLTQTLIMGWIAAAGRFILEILGHVTHEEGIPGRLVGLVLLLAAIFLFQHFRGSLPPEGNPQGSGFKFGYRLIFAANILGAFLFVFPFTFQFIENRDVVMILSKFAVAFGYLAVGMWTIAFSFLYQSSLPESAQTHTK